MQKRLHQKLVFIEMEQFFPDCPAILTYCNPHNGIKFLSATGLGFKTVFLYYIIYILPHLLFKIFFQP